MGCRFHQPAPDWRRDGVGYASLGHGRLRLEYDQVRVEQTGTDLEAAVRQFVTARPGVPKHIYCTYTSMLRVRAELAKLTIVADARRAMNARRLTA